AVAYFLFSHCVSRMQGAASSQRGLFNYRQIKPIDIILARTLTEAVMMLVVAGVFVLGWIWFGQPMRIQDPLMMFAALLLLYVLGVALGLIFEVYGTVFPDMRRIFGMAMRPMLFISGLFFSMEMVPHVYRPLLFWNPVLHAVDLVRDAVIHGYTSPGSLLYVCCCALVLLFFGLSAYRRYLYRLI
ncbi:MAG: ABC transporter permease, partial [Pseudomonadota bacterium]|nr:ABC transporter permease [Pseudomonadota bacterium]